MTQRRLFPLPVDGCTISGFLYEDDDRARQGEDMLDVALANGVLISAGWYPEGDPDGCYCVMVYRGYERLIPVIECDSIDSALEAVVECMHRFSGRNLQNVTDADSTFAEVKDSWSKVA